MLRVQRYVNDIRKIIEKTEVYGREMGIIGKYLKMNIGANIRNYLDMIYDRRGFTREELIIVIREFSEYLDDSLMDEYGEHIDTYTEEDEIPIRDMGEDTDGI
ncbi:MAG: hypothetical protein GX340_02730 [Clostridiales bacterium]|nr:hypothetical protein [Clostridiales bacterium]